MSQSPHSPITATSQVQNQAAAGTSQQIGVADERINVPRRECLTRPGTSALPDGPRAWTVVFGTFCAGMALLGQVYSGGIFVVPLMNEYNTKLSETSLVATMSLVMFYVFGIFSTHMSDQLGIRIMTGTGTVIWTLGWILGSFATQLWQSILTQGVLCGIGVAFIYWPMISILPQWFRKYRATAMGLAVLGSGIGSIAISFGGQHAITELGWRNTLRVVGGIGTALLIIAVLLVDRRVVPAKSHRGFFARFVFASKDLLRFRSAQLFMVAVFFFQFGFFVPYTYLSPYSTSLGMPASFGGFALSMLGVGSACGRIIFGPIADRVGRFVIYKITMFLSVVSLAVWPACTTQPSIIAFAFFYGLFGSGFAAMFAVVAADLWGPERLSGVFTLVNLVSIPGAFAAGPTIGALVQSTGGYGSAIGFTAAMMAFAALLTFCVRQDASAKAASPRASGAHPPSVPNSHPPAAEPLMKNDDQTKGVESPEVMALEEDMEAHLPASEDYIDLFRKYNVDLERVKHASDEERQMYVRAVQLCEFREAYPDVPEDVFSRALTALREHTFDALKVKVQEKFGSVPDAWEYQEMTML